MYTIMFAQTEELYSEDRLGCVVEIKTKMFKVFTDDLIPGLIDLRDRNIPGSAEAIIHVYDVIDRRCEFITPSCTNVLRSVELPPEDVRVMIIGQDPYPAYGAATGLAFSIDEQVGATGSGKSVYRMAMEIYRSEGYDIPKTLSGNLDHWQDQGVMLLNAALTTQTGMINAHSAYWRSCVRGIIFDYIQSNHDIIVLCLGAKAKKLVGDIEIKHVFYSQHPNAPNTKLIGSNVFVDINDLLWENEIDWRLMEDIDTPF